MTDVAWLLLAALGLLSIAAAILLLAWLHTRRKSAALSAELAARDAEARLVWQAGLEVAAAPDYSHVLRAVVDRARDLLAAEASALCLWDEQKRWWVVQGASGAADAFEVAVQRFAPMAGAQPVTCPVVRFHYRQAHLDMPVVRDGQIIGCLCVANAQPRAFSRHERELLSGIADQTAVAIQQTRRMENEGNRASAAERERLGREIHDTLAQLLGFVGFKTQAVRELLAQGQIEAARAQLDQLYTLSQALYADTRELILGLRSEMGPAHALMPALADYVKQFSEFSGVPTAFTSEGFAANPFSPAAELQLMRVVQEALSNIRKHAHARAASVRFAREGDWAIVAIADDGQGFDPGNIARGQWPRFGLQSMRERVEAVGGTLAIQSAPTQGTTVTIRLPIVVRGGGPSG